MSPIASYRRLLDLAGPGYVVVAFLGRLPLAMSQMGTLLLVSGTTGRYAAGGLAAGALAVANAVCSPFAGGLADRIGQRPVVLVQSTAGGVGLVGLVVLARHGAGESWLVLTAATAGAVLPQIGPLARVRWRPITHGSGNLQPRLVDAAFSYEGAADEASFVLGPAVVGLISVAIDPGGSILFAAAILLVFGCWFALHPTAGLTHAHRPSVRSLGRLLTVAFAVLLGAQLCVGMIFGSVQTGATVLATAAGQAGLAGFVHATLGVGSVLAGLAVAGVPRRIGLELRVLAAASALFVLSVPLLFVGALVPLVLVVLVMGCAVAPYMISNFTLAERVVPRTRVGTAMTLLAGSTGVGYALGSSVAGRLADGGGHSSAFAVTVASAGLAVGLAAASQRALRSALVSAGGEPVS